jgi:hypothetical protein
MHNRLIIDNKEKHGRKDTGQGIGVLNELCQVAFHILMDI